MSLADDNSEAHWQEHPPPPALLSGDDDQDVALQSALSAYERFLIVTSEFAGLKATHREGSMMSDRGSRR